MTVYLEVAQALVASGYLSDADVQAAAAVLAANMTVADFKRQEIMAMDDLMLQQDLIAEAKAEAAAAAELGDDESLARHSGIIENAEEAELQDRERIAAARDALAAVSRKAAEALVSASLVDAANADDVVAVIGRARW